MADVLGSSLFSSTNARTPFRPETSTTFGESWPANFGRTIIVPVLLCGSDRVNHPHLCAVKRVFPRSQIGLCSFSNCIRAAHDSQSNRQLSYFGKCKAAQKSILFAYCLYSPLYVLLLLSQCPLSRLYLHILRHV